MTANILMWSFTDKHINAEWKKDTEWMEDAKCYNDRALRDWQRDNREDQFFDETDGRTSHKQMDKIKRAKEYCKSCPVGAECEYYATKYDEDGLYNGTTRRERLAKDRKVHKDLQELQERLKKLQQGGESPIAS